MRIVGIDPGIRITGFGCIDAPRDVMRPTLVEAGVFRLRSSGAGAGAGGVASRLADLERDMADLLARTGPDLVAVESLFAHVRHPATAITMGHARGVILLAAQRAGVELIECKPNEVKKSTTGYGHASKEQMQHAIKDTFGLAQLPAPADMADAIAIAICAAHRRAAFPLHLPRHAQ